MLLENNENPFVSVVIPNYNHARFLEERIQSVLNQTYQNFELIILDDKSTDNSVEVINKYKDNPHVSHIVVNEENSGSTFKQWKRGFELAKGDVVWIAESDDSCETNMLETLIKGYVEHNAVLAFCRSCKYDVDGTKSQYVLQTCLPWDIIMPGKEFVSRYMVQCNAVANASSAIFNRELAMHLDSQYTIMNGNGDWLFWIELMEHGGVFFCNQTLNFFRHHGSNTTRQVGNKGLSAIEHKVIFDYLTDNGYVPRNEVSKMRLKTLDFYLNSEYDSLKTRRKVLTSWDRYRLGRFRLFLSSIKRDVLLFMKNV